LRGYVRPGGSIQPGKKKEPKRGYVCRGGMGKVIGVFVWTIRQKLRGCAEYRAKPGDWNKKVKAGEKKRRKEGKKRI